jgi:hypothetical protein
MTLKKIDPFPPITFRTLATDIYFFERMLCLQLAFLTDHGAFQTISPTAVCALPHFAGIKPFMASVSAEATQM